MDDNEKRQRKIARMVERWRGISYAKAVKETKKQFQLMIRLEAVEQDGQVFCCCCLKRYPPRSNLIDAGHWIGAEKSYRTCFDERNVHPQCVSCNRWDNNGTAQIQYTTFMHNNYGQEVMDELLELAKDQDRIELEELAELRQGFMERIRLTDKT